MKRINYKSDIPPILLSLSVDGHDIDISESDFIVRFYIDGYEGRHYDCSHINGVWHNCEPAADDIHLICYLDNQRLGIGVICAEFHYLRQDKGYEDGVQRTVVILDSDEVGIELVEDNGDTVSEAAISVTLPFIYRDAYNIAVDHGYTGTADEFYKALANVVAIDNAENERKVAERNREQNEEERQANEDVRQTNEQERKNNEASRIKAEKIRVENENLRIENEEDRKTSFDELTESFNDFSSQAKVEENNRKSNELERQANEDVRLSEESKRKNAERIRLQNELDRDTAEELRKIEENNRVKNEDIRVANEKSREERLAKKADNEELYVVLQSMGFELDNVGGGSYAYAASVGEAYFDASDKHVKYVASVGDVQDLGEPSDKKVYCNAHTKLLYIWRSGAWVNVGGVDAYTKSESDERYAVKATEGKVTALQKTVNENYADLGGRLGYAEDAIVQVGNDVKNLRSDTVSALDKKCDQEQYDAFKGTVTDKFDELDNTLAGKADEESVSALKDDVNKTMDEFNTAIGNLGTEIADTQSDLKSQLSTKQDILTAGPGIVIASNIISAREEVLYDEWFYPNKKPTTDLVDFRDSYEVLQPTAYVGDYTDADGTQWNYVFECESFPDWFDWSIAHCYPYNNGIAYCVLYLNSFEVTDAGEVTYYMYNNRAIGTESAYNMFGAQKIDDTHFTVHSGSAIGSSNFNPSTVNPSLFGFCSPIIRELYDVTDCKKLRIEWSGQIKLRNLYSDCISVEGSVATCLRGYYGGQVVYGTTINDFEISDDKTKYRVTRSSNSMFYRQNVNGHPNNGGLKELSSDFVMTSRWYTLNYGAVGLGIIVSGGKRTIVVSTNGANNPTGAINMGSRLRIIKLE